MAFSRALTLAKAHLPPLMQTNLIQYKNKTYLNELDLNCYLDPQEIVLTH